MQLIILILNILAGWIVFVELRKFISFAGDFIRA